MRYNLCYLRGVPSDDHCRVSNVRRSVSSTMVDLLLGEQKTQIGLKSLSEHFDSSHKDGSNEWKIRQKKDISIAYRA